LRDAEVEQLHAPVGCDENIRRLEIAMNDEMLMRVADGVAHVLEEREPVVERERSPVAVPGDRHAVDELHRKVGKPARGDATVDQPRDVRMLEQGEDPPLLEKAANEPGGRMPDQLERDALVEETIVALAEEHLAHAALADTSDDAKG